MVERAPVPAAGGVETPSRSAAMRPTVASHEVWAMTSCMAATFSARRRGLAFSAAAQAATKASGVSPR